MYVAQWPLLFCVFKFELVATNVATIQLCLMLLETVFIWSRPNDRRMLEVSDKPRNMLVTRHWSDSGSADNDGCFVFREREEDEQIQMIMQAQGMLSKG